MSSISVNLSRLNIDLYCRVQKTNILFTRDILKTAKKTEHTGMENVSPGKCQTSYVNEGILISDKMESTRFHQDGI
jgi:hypothetical protein